ADQRLMLSRDLEGSRRHDTQSAISDQETAIRHAFGDESPDYADVRVLRCKLYHAEKRYIDAIGCWQQVLPIYEKAVETELPLASAYDGLAADLLEVGKPSEALSYYEKELEL